MDAVDAIGSNGRSAGYQYQFGEPQKAPGAVLKKEDIDSFFYKMNHKHRGYAVVINNQEFDIKLGRPKINSEDNCSKIKELLENMGFSVNVYENCSVKMMENVMKDVSERDHKDMDCFVCVVLTYGDEGIFYGTDDTVVMDDFIKPVKGNNCPSLALKPKVFFVQACKYIEPQFESHAEGAEAENEVIQTRRIPHEADVLTMYSVLPVDKSSLFIQAICTEFTKMSNDNQPAWKRLDLLSLMTRVNRQVSESLESWLRENNQRLPCVTSMLTKVVQFA